MCHRLVSSPRYARVLGIVFVLILGIARLDAAELSNPPQFRSHNGVLDILMIARAKTISLGEFQPTAWVYEICYRRDAVGNTCPKNSKTAASYGGMQLALQAGDHLKIRFINQLPPAPPDADHVAEMGDMLADNPTNLHTHGLIVEPRRATSSDPTYGDYVYVLSYPSGKLPSMQHPGLDYTDKPLDYDIYIPTNHPSGLFWIHPHVHGLALNQVSEGLAGVITVGDPGNYVSDTKGKSGLLHGRSRILTLKDMQVFATGDVFSQEDPGFCDPDPVPGEGERKGFCPGIRYSDDTGTYDYTGGKWFFTINGQVYPTMTVTGTGELWRLVNTSGSRSYDLALENNANDQRLQMQIVSMDGIALDGSAPAAVLVRRLQGRVKPEPCANGDAKAVCASGIRMMPSSRVEVWVSSKQPGVRSADLVTHSYQTGPDGDDWAETRLAHVVFPQSNGGVTTVAVAPTARILMGPSGLLGDSVRISGGKHPDGMVLNTAKQALPSLKPDARKSLVDHLASLSAPSELSSPVCAALPAGHKRRVFFGTPADNPDAFGLGYEEVDEHGQPVPGTFRDIEEFDHTFITICLPLATGNKAVAEPWELINVAGEDHNFHIHQTKFTVVQAGANDTNTGALVDNVPVPHGSLSCDGTIQSWRSGACEVQPVGLSIPFSEVGDFVYHCHILEHEDGGMMAHIRVIPHQ